MSSSDILHGKVLIVDDQSVNAALLERMLLGAPAMPHKEFKRVNAAIQRLPETLAKIHELEQQLAELRARLTTAS